MPSDSSLPPFDEVRLAGLGDLPRIATVAAAGFFWSPTFQFQRPHYADYVEDTLSSYWIEYQSAIRDPATVVLVVEDVWDKAEREGVYDALRTNSMYEDGINAQAKAIVGICSINLKPGSWRVGQFQTESHVDTPEPHAVLSMLNRDQCPSAIERYSQATSPAKKKYLAGLMRLSTVAVHPAYWRRGHASRLISWCTQLADMDDTPLGVSAAPMGANLAAKVGFEEQETVRIQRTAAQGASSSRDAADIGDVELWVAVRPPSHSPSDGSTVGSGSGTPRLDLQ